MHDFVAYLLREQESRLFHIGNFGEPLCGAELHGPLVRIFLPERLGMAHSVCADCRLRYEAERARVKGEASQDSPPLKPDTGS